MTSVVATRQPTRQPRPRVDRCEYLASRGLTGIQPLKAIVGRAKKNGWDWINRIKLHGAVMNDHSVSLTYLVDTVGECLLDLQDEEGNTALHHGCIWGRNSCVVYLLSKGAALDLLNKKGESVLEMAETRQKKLLNTVDDVASAKGDLTKADIEKMIVEGQDLIRILEGSMVQGLGYREFAKRNSGHHLVAKHSPWAVTASMRLDLCLLRSLVLKDRAFLTDFVDKAPDDKAVEGDEAGKKPLAEEKAPAAGVPQVSIEEALKQGNLTEKCYSRSMRYLQVTTVTDLREIRKDMIAQLDLSAKERRQLWLFIKDKQQHVGSTAGDEKKPKGGKKHLSRKEKKDQERLKNEMIRKEKELKLHRKRQHESFAVLFHKEMPNLPTGKILNFLF